ncbi:MAG: PA domain-containing protein, partial [Candidatus Promineifilaceae bacterium]
MRKTLFISLLILLVTTAIVQMASAGPAACDTRVNNTHNKLLECVTLDGVREHQAAFQAIADANGGIRTSGTSGYDASAAYVAGRMAAAGYDVTVQEFDFQTFIELSPSVLEEISPLPQVIPNNIMSYSGSGDVTAQVSTLLPITGCDPGDFAGFTPGHIALISRGACTFALKASNADAAGAVGVIIYNNAPGVINGTLSSSFTL